MVTVPAHTVTCGGLQHEDLLLRVRPFCQRDSWSGVRGVVRVLRANASGAPTGGILLLIRRAAHRFCARESVAGRRPRLAAGAMVWRRRATFDHP